MRRKLQELRIAKVLQDAGIKFEANVYVSCTALGGTFRMIDFVIRHQNGVIYLEIGMYAFEHKIRYTLLYSGHDIGWLQMNMGM